MHTLHQKCLQNGHQDKRQLMLEYIFLSHDIASGSDITPCNKIDKTLVENSIWVCTVCKSTHLGFSSIQRVKGSLGTFINLLDKLSLQRELKAEHCNKRNIFQWKHVQTEYWAHTCIFMH